MRRRPADPKQFATIEDAVVNAVLAGLDGDRQREILFQSYDVKLHAWWLDKTAKHSWPFAIPGGGLRFGAAPAVADLDGNGQAEVIFATWPPVEISTGKYGCKSRVGLPATAQLENRRAA